MQLLKLQYTEKMSRFRWSSLYSPKNKSKFAFKFWHPRVHDYCTILCSRPFCVSRNTNKLLQQFLCTSAKYFMLIIGSAPVNLFYFIFLLKTKESASLAWLFLHTGRWPACIESVFYWICGSRIFSLETLPIGACKRRVQYSEGHCCKPCLLLLEIHRLVSLTYKLRPSRTLLLNVKTSM